MKTNLVFDENGGYDCMCAAYLIQDTAGRTLAKIDLAEWLTAMGVPEPFSYELLHAENDGARLAAETMAHALDERWKLAEPGHVLIPDTAEEAQAMHAVAERFLKDRVK